LQLHWVGLFATGAVAPVVVAEQAPGWFPWAAALGLALAAGAVASAWAWRRGADAGALAPLTAALAAGVLIGYGALAPAENDHRSHRALADALDRLLPPGARTVMFFHELDEGLWFYLRDRALVPVPGSQPAYNDAYRLAEDMENNRLELDPDKRAEAQRKILLDWLDRPAHDAPYVLIRREKYERFAPALAGRVEPVYREHGMKRNELVLMRLIDPSGAGGVSGVAPAPVVAGPPSGPGETRRQ
jgi:hypothetical protein